MKLINHRSALVAASVLTILAGVSGCAVENGSPSVEPQEATEAAVQPLYSEKLANGAELVIQQVSENGVAVGVSAPIEIQEALKPQLEAAAAERTLEGVYRALAGAERTLPAALEGVAGRVRLAAERAPNVVAPAADLLDSSASEEAGLVRSTQTRSGDVGSIKQALGQDDTMDWTADANWFAANYCTVDSYKRLSVDCLKNYSWVYQSRWGRYHMGSGMAASFNGQATFQVHYQTCSNCAWVEYTNLRVTMDPRWIYTWQFLGDETYINRLFRMDGLGPTPRVHMSVSYGYPKINSATVTATQTPTYYLRVKGTGMKPSTSMNMYYLHPTRGAIGLGNWSTKSDGTFDFNNTTLRCEALYMSRTSPYFTGTIQAKDSEGRVANYSTSGLYNACYPFLPAQ